MADSNRLADSIFRSQPEQAVLITDIYEIENPDLVNDFASSIEAQQAIPTEDAPSPIADMEAAAKEYKAENLGQAKSTKTTPADIKKSIMSTSKEVAAAFNSLNKQHKSYLTGVKSVNSKITSTIRGVTKTIDAATLPTLKAISNIVNKLYNVDCTPKLTDKGSLIAFSTNLIKFSAMMGLIDSIKCIFSSNALSKDMLASIVKNLVPHIAIVGDVDLLQRTSETEYAKMAYSGHPGFFYQFLYNYRNKKDLKPSEYPATYTTVLTSFSNIFPDWNVAKREGGDALEASHIVTCSNDFLKLITSECATSTVDFDSSGVIDGSSQNYYAFTDKTDVGFFLLIRQNYTPLKPLKALRKEFPDMHFNSIE